MPGLDDRRLPKLGQQALLADKGTQHVQREAYLQCPDRFVSRSLRRLAQDLERQVDQGISVSLPPSALLAEGQRQQGDAR